MIVVDVVYCRRCRSMDRPCRLFRLVTDVRLAPTPNVARAARHAGTTILCEPCWRDLVEAVAA